MRDILFRAKQKYNKQWVQGSLLFYPGVNRAFVSLGEFRGSNFIEVQKETVGQYTGLTDKNGTKIFEGDIVQSIELELKGIIVFDERCRFVIKDLTTGSTYLLSYNNDEIQVIGNMPDNPELLKDGGSGE